jgi:hypothetical protein
LNLLLVIIFFFCFQPLELIYIQFSDFFSEFIVKNRGSRCFQAYTVFATSNAGGYRLEGRVTPGRGKGSLNHYSDMAFGGHSILFQWVPRTKECISN